MTCVECVLQSALGVIGHHPELLLLNTLHQIQLRSFGVKLVIQVKGPVGNVNILVLILQVYVTEIPSILIDRL
jgi:hypothetical protein